MGGAGKVGRDVHMYGAMELGFAAPIWIRVEVGGVCGAMGLQLVILFLGGGVKSGKVDCPLTSRYSRELIYI